MKGQTLKKFIILGAIIVPIYMVYVFCMITGAINTSYNGFAVDNNGLLYVGIGGKIDIYDNDEFVRSVKHNILNGYYRFTIYEEYLQIVDAEGVLEMDLMGNLIEEREDDSTKEIHRLNRQRNSFVTDDATYKATGVLGYYKITKYNNNGEREIVFQSPVFEFILQMVAVIGFFGYIFAFVIFRAKWLMKEKEKQQRGEN